MIKAANDDELGNAWGRVADRGRLCLDVMTKAHAESQHYRLRPGAKFLMIARSDDYGTTEVCAESLHSVQHFIAEMAPRSVTPLCAPHEDPVVLLELLQPQTLVH